MAHRAEDADFRIVQDSFVCRIHRTERDIWLFAGSCKLRTAIGAKKRRPSLSITLSLLSEMPKLRMTAGRLWIMKPRYCQFGCRIGKLLSDGPLISRASTDDLLPG
jgi:hypothetical protein